MISKQAALDILDDFEKDIENGVNSYGEYRDRLWSLSERLEWIPCSERLPEDSGEYLVCPSDSVLEDYSEFGEVTIMPYDADCEGFGWWKDRFDPVSLGYVDSDFIEYEVIAWMPLPEAYRKEDEK